MSHFFLFLAYRYDLISVVFFFFFFRRPRNRFEQVHELEAEMDSLNKPHQQFAQVHAHTVPYHNVPYHNSIYRTVSTMALSYRNHVQHTIAHKFQSVGEYGAKGKGQGKGN